MDDSFQMYRALVELTEGIHWEMDVPTGKFTYVSPQIRKILGYPPERWSTLEAWADTVHPDDREYAVNYCKTKTENSEDHSFQYRVLNAQGETVWLQDIVKVITEGGRPVRLLGIMFDITEKKETEEALMTSERRLRTVISGAPVGIVVCNAAGQCISANRAMADIIGATEEQILRQNYHDLESWKRSGLYEKAVSAVRNNRTEHLDVELVSSFGKKIYISSYFTPLGSGELLIMMQDISELLKTQKELGKALEEKNLLMREVQHRTKNNLFTIQSLLSLHAQDTSDERSREHLTEAKNRVNSMALIYEMLNRTDAATRLGGREYIRMLADRLFSNYSLNSQAVRLEYDIAEIDLDVNTLIPLGLIINELVSNALKYAFPGGREGTLTISLKALDGTGYELVIRDDGTGLPEGFDLQSAKSLGLQIVGSLVRQIRGTLEVTNSEGAEFRIRFSEEFLD